MIVLMVGPPGSGKGTHGIRLAAHLCLQHTAAGDLLRAEVATDTVIGRRVAPLMEAGELVPDLVIAAVLIPVILSAAEHGGYVLDGYPRSLSQADLTREFVDRLQLRPDLVVYPDVPKQELIRCILARAKVERRSDDTPDVIANRLRVFHNATRPLLDFYREIAVLRAIDPTRSIDDVTADVIAAADAIRAN